MTKMADMPLYGKKPFKNILQNPKADDLWTWYVTFEMWGLPIKFVQMMILGWPWPN